MKEYSVYNYGKKEVKWEEVPYVWIQEYPWYEKGKKQNTKVQMAIADDTIHIRMWTEDTYIRANALTLNDPVYEDSCFEFFVTPWNEKSKDYFNIEISCIGTLYMAYRDQTKGRVLISESQARGVNINSSLSRENTELDHKEWRLEISIPLSILEEIAGKPVHQDEWYGNFYRCGGREDDQYACWNPIEFPTPSFHQPKQFGKLVIENR